MPAKQCCSAPTCNKIITSLKAYHHIILTSMRNIYKQMRASTSPTPLSPSPTKRAVYLNQEINKKQVNTNFHSPYKHGRPNPDFVNPSLVSSQLLYHKDTARESHSPFTVTQNYIPTPGDRELQRLRTMRQQNSGRSLTPKKKQQVPSPLKLDKSRQKESSYKRQFYKTPMGNNPLIRTMDPEEALRKELAVLHSYRQKLEEPLHNRTTSKLREVPAYLQQLRKDQRHEIERERLMRSQLAVSCTLQEGEKMRKNRRQHIEKTQEIHRTTQLIQQNDHRLTMEEERHSREGLLLRGILLEQIRANQARKVKQRY